MVDAREVVKKYVPPELRHQARVGLREGKKVVRRSKRLARQGRAKVREVTPTVEAKVRGLLPDKSEQKVRRKKWDARYEAVVTRIPVPLSAPFVKLRKTYSYPWGSAFNGQEGRQQIVRDLFGLGFDQVVETGTWRGTSTEFFADLTSIPIETVEAVPRTYEYARRRLARRPYVHTHLGDSRDFLRGLSSTADRRTFFYLDAHWYEDLPLAEELEIIFRTWPTCVILIDDFEVPDQPRYRFDDYGPGKKLCAEYVGPLPDGWRMYYPTLPAPEETGARRGCGVIASPEFVPGVDALDTLKRRV